MTLAITWNQQQTNTKLWIGLAFFSLVLLSLGWGTVNILNWLEDEQKLPIQQIDISGDFRFISPQEVESTIRHSQPGSFFELDVEQALKDVEALPWVYKASIRKNWPNKLHVHLVEQQAVASWNHGQLLNTKAGTFDAEVPQELTVPALFGPVGGEETALDGYKNMQAVLQQSGSQQTLSIKELILTERHAWTLTLDNGLQLRLGRVEAIDRLQRFVNVYPLLLQQEQEPLYVDLRYDTGLSVGWKENKNQ